MPVSAVVSSGAGGGSAVLLVPPPPLEKYVPQVGDQWVVAVLREPGVPVVGPDGWTQIGAMYDVEDPQVPGRRGEVTFWHRMLAHGEGGQAVVFVLAAAVWAKAVLQTYRPGVEPGDGGLAGALVGADGQWDAELEG